MVGKYHFPVILLLRKVPLFLSPSVKRRYQLQTRGMRYFLQQRKMLLSALAQRKMLLSTGIRHQWKEFLPFAPIFLESLLRVRIGK